MNIAQLAGSAFSFVADVIASKVLAAAPQKAQDLMSRITGGFISKDACAARAQTNAAIIDSTFPFVERMIGSRPSQLIERPLTGLTSSAALRAREFAETVQSYVGPIHNAIKEYLSPKGDAVKT